MSQLYDTNPKDENPSLILSQLNWISARVVCITDKYASSFSQNVCDPIKKTFSNILGTGKWFLLWCKLAKYRIAWYFQTSYEYPPAQIYDFLLSSSGKYRRM